MAKAVLIARVLMGLPLIVFGLNTFFRFLEPDPEAFPAAAWDWLNAMQATGYLNGLKGGVEILCGVLFVTGRLVPFALVIFAPVLVNIVAFHIYLSSPSTGAIAFLMLAIELFLAWAYGKHFAGVLSFNAKPRGST
jgi:putative oxidoreductase